MKKLVLLLVFSFSSFFAISQEAIRTMFYNILDFPEAVPHNRPEILAEIIKEVNPDIFMVCELQSEAGADIILETAMNFNGEEYARAPFIPSLSGAIDHQQLIFYRRKMFSLEAIEAMETEVRDINYYQLKLSTADQSTDPVLIDIFVSHFKSSPGHANEQLRLDMAQKLTSKLATLDSDAFVLFSGDLNFYSATEPGYQELTDPDNNITLTDPLDRPGHWHENQNFSDIHTQSTRISAGPFGGAGAGGGLDDRFDFILISENMVDDPKLRYLPNSYKTFGNNGNCYKNNVNSPDCTGFYNQEIRDYLYNMSDHLPVVLDLETNKEIVLSTPSSVSKDLLKLNETIVTKWLHLEISPSVQKNISIEIYNVLGQKVLTHHTNNPNEISLDVAAFADGIYFLKTNLPHIPTIKFLKIS